MLKLQGKVSLCPLCVFYKPAQYEVCHWSLQAHPEVGYVVFNCTIVSSLDIYAEFRFPNVEF